MNLVPCRHCGERVAYNAKRCPHCGGGTATKHAQRDAKWSLIIMAILVSLPFLWIMYVCA